MTLESEPVFFKKTGSDSAIRFSIAHVTVFSTQYRRKVGSKQKKKFVYAHRPRCFSGAGLSDYNVFPAEKSGSLFQQLLRQFFHPFFAFSTGLSGVGCLLYLLKGSCPLFYCLKDISFSDFVAGTDYLFRIHPKAPETERCKPVLQARYPAYRGSLGRRRTAQISLPGCQHCFLLPPAL